MINSSGVFTVQSQNASGQSTKVSATTYVTLASSSSTGIFSDASISSKTCDSDFTKTSVTIATNSANKGFCYKDSAQGTFAITVSATNFLPDSQNIINTTSPSNN